MLNRFILKKKFLYEKIFLVSFIIVAIAILGQTFNYRIGNIFFGKVPALYNVTLAQFFFQQAANPMFGKPTPYANHQLSRTHFIKGELTKSLEIAKKEIEVYPDHKATLYIIGLTLGYMNREEEAIDAFTEYIEYNPKTWAGRNDKAWLQFRIGDIDGALVTIEPVVTSTGIANPWVQNTYGTLLMNKKRYNEAEEAFLRAKKLADSLSEEAWGVSYPGNDPRIYATGLSAMKKSIETNLQLVKEHQQ